jgi:hypothetical protein
MRFLKSLTLALVLLCGLALTAQASLVPPFQKADYVIGSVDYAETFTISEPGIYVASIEDFQDSTPFNELRFAITNPPGRIGSADGAGGTALFTFEGTPGVTYTAHIVGVLGSPSAIGGFGAQVSAIPIPPSLLLLGSGLIGLVILRRKRS